MNQGPDQTGQSGAQGGVAPPVTTPAVAQALPAPPPARTLPPGMTVNGHPGAYAPLPDDAAGYRPAAPQGESLTTPRRAIFADVRESVQAWFAPRRTLRASDVRRNLPLGVAIAALGSFADALLLPSVVVAAFVAQVSDANRLIALIPVVAALAWGLPGAIAGSAIANRAGTVLPALASAAVRTLAMGLLAFIGADRASGTARTLLVTFFVLYALAGCAGGFATLVAQRLPGRIATEGVRGRLVRWQALASGAAAIFAALLVRRALVYGPPFPRNYLYLFFISFVALVGVTLLTAGLTERANRVPLTPRPFAAGLRAAPDLLRLPSYRRYLIFRVVALLATLAEPFYVVYAIRTFAPTVETIGGYAVAVIATRVVTMYLWRALARLTGTKLLLQLGALCRALAAVAAIGLPVLYETEPIASRFTTDASRATAFGVVFLCIGAAMGANAVAQTGLLLDILPPNAHADGFAFANGLLATCSIGLIAGGIILDRTDARTLFLVALILGLVTVLVGGIVREPRRPLRRSGALGPGIRRTEAFSTLPRESGSFSTLPPYQR